LQPERRSAYYCLEKEGKVYHVFNAENMFFGEIISRASVYLRGKHKPIYHRTKWYLGDTVIVVNAEKLTIPGGRMKTKVIRYHTGYPGNLRSIPYKDLVFKKPEYLFFRGVYKQLPRNRIRFRILENLHI
jgi:large subunit ribosomal protein L13